MVFERTSPTPVGRSPRASAWRRRRRLAEFLEVLHRVTQVALDRTAEEPLRDAGEHTAREGVLELNRDLGPATRLRKAGLERRSAPSSTRQRLVKSAGPVGACRFGLALDP